MADMELESFKFSALPFNKCNHSTFLFAEPFTHPSFHPSIQQSFSKLKKKLEFCAGGRERAERDQWGEKETDICNPFNNK